MNAPLFRTARAAPAGPGSAGQPDAHYAPHSGLDGAHSDGVVAPAAPDPTAMRPALTTGLITSLLLVLGVGGWAVFAAIDGAIIAPGQVEAARTRLAIQHPEGGRITELAVSDGEMVAAGTLLARIDPGLLEAERAIVETQFLEALARQARLLAERDAQPGQTTLRSLGLPTHTLPHALPDTLPDTPPGATTLSPAERDRLAVMLDGQTRLLRARQESLAQQLAQIGLRRAQAIAQRDGLAAQREALDQEVALVAAELDQQRRLVTQGLAPEARRSALAREAARLRGAQAAARAEHAAIGGRIAELDQQRLALEADRREEAEAALRDLGVSLVELATRRNLLDARLARLEIRAPQAGRIHGLALGGPGTVLRPAEPLAELVPAPGTPIIALHLRPEDIERVSRGQEVRVLLPAGGDSGRDRPELVGHVTLISADLVEDARRGGAYFRAEVAIAPLPAEQRGSGPDPPLAAALHPGLPVEGHIRTGARSPLQWFLAPIRTQIGRAMRGD